MSLRPIRQPWRAIVGGLFVGGIAMWWPGIVGNGYEPLNGILDIGMPIEAVLILMVTKTIATSASVPSGIPGGIFTPTLLIGAALGAGWSDTLVVAPS